MPVFMIGPNEYSILLVVLNVSLYVTSLIVSQIYMTGLFFTLMSWVSKLTKMNKSARPSEAFVSAKRCLELYTGLEEGMGLLFFCWTSVCQIAWITMIFLAMSMATDGLSEASYVVNFLVYFFGAMATMLQATAFILCLSDCHKSLEILGDSLTGDILDMDPGRERHEAELLLKVGVKNHDFP